VNMKMVVTFKHPRNTERPVPAWYTSKRSGNTLKMLDTHRHSELKAFNLLGLFVPYLGAADDVLLPRKDCKGTLEREI
jgi:hypothetical protein